MRLLAQKSNKLFNPDVEAIITASVHFSSFNNWDPLREIQ